MSVFADTSALYPLLVKTDVDHHASRLAFEQLLTDGREIWTSSFVLVETMALLQHRIGLSAARDFDHDIVPVLRVDWIEDQFYRRSVERLWRDDRRRLSLVDCVSFECMTRRGLRTAFAFDPHFAAAGFDVIPA